jgi:hypothetical protein
MGYTPAASAPALPPGPSWAGRRRGAPRAASPLRRRGRHPPTMHVTPCQPPPRLLVTPPGESKPGTANGMRSGAGKGGRAAAGGRGLGHVEKDDASLTVPLEAALRRLRHERPEGCCGVAQVRLPSAFVRFPCATHKFAQHRRAGLVVGPGARAQGQRLQQCRAVWYPAVWYTRGAPAVSPFVAGDGPSDGGPGWQGARGPGRRLAHARPPARRRLSTRGRPRGARDGLGVWFGHAAGGRGGRRRRRRPHRVGGRGGQWAHAVTRAGPPSGWCAGGLRGRSLRGWSLE